MKRLVQILVPVVVLVVLGYAVTQFEPGKEDVETAAPLNWYKGNTHTHTLWSDGNDFPEMIVAWYQERGYDFLALSDHNILSRGEKWMKVEAIDKRKKKPGATALEKYGEKFGDEWVELRGEGAEREVRLKALAEFRSKFEKPGEFLLIEAEEITDRFRNNQVHINALNLQELIPPQKGASVVETVRNNLRMVAEQAERLGRPILAHLNHPNFHYSFTAEQLAEVLEEQFFEVYNGHPGINHLGDAEHPGDEELWDVANALRLGKLKAAPLFGVATDDSHDYHGGNVSPGRGWVMVRSEKLEANALIEAMKKGDFYASTGVVLDEVSHADGVLLVKARVQDGVDYEIQFIGTRQGEDAEPGEVLAINEGPSASYPLQGDELYVRAVVTSSRSHPNPSFTDQQEQAWTQPVGWR
jgi:hypothetical protein